MFPNMHAKYVLPDSSIAPPNTPGELWLSGPNVFKGYWRNKTATSESLTSDGYFKTGDVGYQDSDHNFYITDRVKELIKYKGFQVAPAELEGKLMDHPLIDDVAVIGVEDREMHTEVPRAYVVLSKDVEEKRKDEVGREIVEWVAGKVANHKKLRGGVRFVDEVPKSAAGKILRRVLKDRAKQEEAKEGGKPKL
jgi:4-coumarate--CoA ligase